MRYRNGCIEELWAQLRYSPESVRADQARRVEDLIPEIRADSAYPYEYVCYRVTRFRPASHLDVLIPGADLQADLHALLLDLSKDLSLPAEEERDAPLPLDVAARRFGVSMRTVGRWRQAGLVARYFVFDGCDRRLAVRPATLEAFVQAHPECLARAEKYRPVSDEEEKRILDLARQACAAGMVGLSLVARRVAEETGRSTETVRRVLRRADRASDDGRLFPEPTSRLTEVECRDLARQFREGAPVRDLCRRYDRSEATIYRALHHTLVSQALGLTVKFVPSPEFEAPDADKKILGETGLFVIPPEPVASPPKSPPQLPAYLRELYRIPLLTREQEHDLFRRYNFVKWRMARLQSEIRATGYRVALLDAFEAHSAAAGTLRQILVRSNLRLVVSIAKRHIGPVMGLFDLISEGNICLMRAVECFDFSRGTRFSTYATWALTKHFARAVPEANYRLSAFVTGQEELIERYGDPREQPSATEEKLAHIKTIISGAVEQLLPRERAVIEARFGTAGQKPHTLQELAALFGLTRERIRQIEARALLRLREHLGPEAADTAGI